MNSTLKFNNEQNSFPSLDVVPFVVIKKEIALGVIKFRRSVRSNGEPPCKCCPGEPGHIYARGVKFGWFKNLQPKHFGHGVEDFLASVVLHNNSFEGKRVRVTVEVLDDG
jgi:hypothetical protein